jgi:hypothetical protein
MYQRYFEAAQREAVRLARRAGHSWQEIAEAAGIARQSAWQKWRATDSPRRARDEMLILPESLTEDERAVVEPAIAAMKPGAFHSALEVGERAARLKELTMAATTLKRVPGLYEAVMRTYLASSGPLMAPLP